MSKILVTTPVYVEQYKNSALTISYYQYLSDSKVNKMRKKELIDYLRHVENRLRYTEKNKIPKEFQEYIFEQNTGE